MREAALGIDVGTSGVRVMAVAADLTLLASGQAALAAPVKSDGRITQDPAMWLAAMQAALAACDLTGIAIRALSVNGTSGTILAVDHDGRAVGHASMYNDTAPPDVAARVDAVAPRDTAARGATSALARALGVDGGARIIHQADWLAGQFSGRCDLSDENNALKTGYDPRARAWPDWIGETGFDPARLPHVLPAGAPMGRISAQAARAFGLPDDVTVVAGTTDGCAAFLASGADTPGDGVTSLGTTLTLKLLSATPVFAPEYGIYSHRIGDQWLAGGASNTGGGALRALFSDAQITALSETLKPDEPTGLDYYPLAHAGERFPINDAGLMPRLSPRPASDALFFQGVLESISAIEALGYERLGELGATRLGSIRSLGGGAANRGWTQIRLARLGVPEKAVLSDQAAVGTARLAWRGIGHAN